MYRVTLQKRVVAALISFVFLFTNHFVDNVYAYENLSAITSTSFSEFPQQLDQMSLPKNIGKIEEVYQGASDQIVLLLQDAHAVPEAQRNIRNMIDYFEQHYGVKKIALEGAASKLAPQLFRSFPDKQLLKKVFNDYLEEGELTGTTMAAIFNKHESDYMGIEDWDLYERGYSFFIETMRIEADIKNQINESFYDLQKIKQKTYSPELLEIDQKLQQFSENQISLLEILKSLSSIKSPAKNSEIELLLSENSRQQTSDIPIELEVRQLAKEIQYGIDRNIQKTSARREVLASFNEKLQAFQLSEISPEEFAVILKNLTAGLGLKIKMSSNLEYLMKQHKRMKDIEGTSFFEEFEAYRESIMKQLLQTKEQIDVHEKSEELLLIKKLAILELSEKQWRELNQKPVYFFGLWDQMKAHRAFYHNAEKRDAVFSEQLQKLFKGKSLFSSSIHTEKEAIVFVSGGFHSKGLTQHLKEKNISYLLMTPSIQGMPDVINYKNHMRGLVSWKNYFEIEKGKINVFKAFVRYTRDQLLEKSSFEQGVVLKSWRDQIVRDLSDKQKIDEAKEHTKYIDELASESHQGELSEEVLTAFTEKLLALEASGRLNQQSVLRLLQPAAFSTPKNYLALASGQTLIANPRFELQAGDLVEQENGTLSIEVLPPEDGEEQTDSSIEIASIEKKKEVIRSELRNLNATEKKWLEILGEANFNAIQSDKYKYLDLISSLDVEYENDRIILEFLAKVDSEILLKAITLEGFSNSLTAASKSTLFVNTLEKHGSTLQGRLALINFPDLLMNPQRLQAMLQQDQFKGEWSFRRVWNAANLYFRTVWFNAKEWMKTTWSGLTMPVDGLLSKVSDLRKEYNDFLAILNRAEAIKLADEKRKKDWLGQAGTNFGREVGYGNIENFFLNYNVQRFAFDKPALESAQLLSGDLKNINDERLSLVLKLLKKNFPKEYRDLYERFTLNPKAGIDDLISLAKTPQSLNNLNRILSLPKSARKELNLKKLTYLINLKESELEALLKKTHVKSKASDVLIQLDQNVLSWLVSEQDQFIVDHFFQNRDRLLKLTKSLSGFYFDAHDSVTAAALASLSAENMDQIFVHIAGVSGKIAETYLKIVIKLIASHKDQKKIDAIVNALNEGALKAWSQNNADDFNKLLGLLERLSVLGDAREDLVLSVINQKGLELIVSLDEIPIHFYHSEKTADLMSVLQDKGIKLSSKTAIAIALSERMRLSAINNSDVNSGVESVPVVDYLQGKLGSKNKGGLKRLLASIEEDNQYRKRALARDILRVKAYEVVNFLKNQKILKPLTEEDKKSINQMEEGWDVAATLKYLTNKGLILGIGAAAELKGNSWVARLLTEEKKYVAFDESILSNDKILLLISLYYNVASETLDFDEKELLQRRIKHTLRQFVAKGVSVSKDFEKILTKKDYQKHQASRRDLEKTIFKPDGSVAKKGYSPDVLDKKIEIKGFVSKGLTEEEKQLQFSNNTFQIVQIAERLGLLPHNAKDEESKRKIIEIETAKIKSAENARKYFEEKIKPHRPNAVKNVLNEDKDHNTEQAEAIVDDLLFNIENILSALERLEKSQDSDASQAEEVRIVIEKNFLEEADAGRCGGSGCFNPYTGIHREMPVIHAFESNAIFASAYDSKGQRISTAVLLLTDEGVYVEKDYNGSQYALDELWLEAFKELAKVSPSIILDSTSAGRHSAIKDKLADKKTTIVKNKKITRQPSIFKDVYFDHGIPDEAGRVVIDLTDPLILTEESIRKAGGYKKSEERRQKYEDQKKRIEQASAPKSKQDAAKEEDIASQFSKLLAKEIQKLGPTAFSIAPHSLIGAVKQFIQVNGVEAISEDNELFKDLVSGKFERDSEDFNKFLALSLSVLDEITSGRSELRAGVDLEKASRAFQRLQKIISEDDFDNFTGEFLDQKRELLEAIQADIAIKNHLARLYDGSLAGWEDYQNSNEPMQELIQFHEAYELMKLKLDYDVDFNQPLNTWAKGEQQEIFLISHKEALKAESFFLALQAREQGLNAITPRLMAYTRPANFVGFYEVPRHVERDIPTMMMTFNPEDAYRPTIDELNVAINYFVNNDLMPRGHSTKHIKSMIRNKFLFNQLYQEFRNSVLFKKLGDKFYAALLFRVLNVLTQEGYDTFQDLTVEDYLTVTQNVLEKIRSHIEKASTFFDMYQLDGGGYRLLAGTDYAFEMEMQSGEFQGLRDLVMDELQELSRSELRNVDEDLTTKLDEVYNEFRRIFREQMIKDEELENSLNNPEIQEYLDEVTEDVLEGAIVSMIDIQRQVREWIKNTTKGLDYDDEFTSSITLAGIIDAHHISGEVHAFIDELIQQDSFTLAEDPMALLMRNFAEEDDTLKIDFNERLEIKKMMASYGEATSSLRLAERLADLIMQNQASLMAVYHEHQEQPFVQFRRSNRGEKLFFEILYNKLFSDEASNKISALLDGNSHALDSALERYEDEKSDRSSFDELTDRFDVGDVKQAYSISHLWNVVETWLQDFNSAARVRYVVGSFSGTQSIAEKNASDRLRDWPSIRNQLAGSKLGLAVSLMKSGENDELYYSLFLQRQIAADGIEELVIADTLSTSDGRRQVKEFIENLQAVQREIPSKIKWYSPFKNQLWKEIEARISQLADELARNVYPDIAKTIHAADLFLIQHRDTPNEPQKLLGILKSLRSELRADASEFSKQLDEMSMDPLPDGTLSEKGKALYDATIGHSVSLPSVIDSFELTEQVLRSDAGTVTSYRINVNFLKQDKKISGYEWNEIVGHLERVETDAGFVMQTKHEDSEVIIDFMRIRNIDPSVVKESPSPEMMRVLLGYIQSKGIRTVRFAYILKRGAEFFERELSKYTKDKSEVKIDFDQLPEDPATHASYYEIDLSDFDFSYSGVLAGKVQRAELRQSEEARNLSDRINGIVNEVVRKSYASDTLQVIDTGDYRRGTNVTDVINLRPTLTGVQGLDRVWTDGSVKDLTPLSAELKNIENVAKHDLQLAELIRELEKRFKDEEASIHFESLKSGPDFRGVVLHFSGVTKDKKNLIIQVTLDESAESFLVEHTAHFLSLMQTLEEKDRLSGSNKAESLRQDIAEFKRLLQEKAKDKNGQISDLLKVPSFVVESFFFDEDDQPRSFREVVTEINQTYLSPTATESLGQYVYNIQTQLLKNNKTTRDIMKIALTKGAYRLINDVVRDLEKEMTWPRVKRQRAYSERVARVIKIGLQPFFFPNTAVEDISAVDIGSYYRGTDNAGVPDIDTMVEGLPRKEIGRLQMFVRYIRVAAKEFGPKVEAGTSVTSEDIMAFIKKNLEEEIQKTDKEELSDEMKEVVLAVIADLKDILPAFEASIRAGTGNITKEEDIRLINPLLADAIVKTKKEIVESGLGTDPEFSWIRAYDDWDAIVFNISIKPVQDANPENKIQTDKNGRLSLDINLSPITDDFGPKHSRLFIKRIDQVARTYGSVRAAKVLRDIQRLKSEAKATATPNGAINKKKKVPGFLIEALFLGLGDRPKTFPEVAFLISMLDFEEGDLLENRVANLEFPVMGYKADEVLNDLERVREFIIEAGSKDSFATLKTTTDYYLIAELAAEDHNQRVKDFNDLLIHGSSNLKNLKELDIGGKYSIWAPLPLEYSGESNAEREAIIAANQEWVEAKIKQYKLVPGGKSGGGVQITKDNIIYVSALRIKEYWDLPPSLQKQSRVMIEESLRLLKESVNSAVDLGRLDQAFTEANELTAIKPGQIGLTNDDRSRSDVWNVLMDIGDAVHEAWKAEAMSYGELVGAADERARQAFGKTSPVFQRLALRPFGLVLNNYLKRVVNADRQQLADKDNAPFAEGAPESMFFGSVPKFGDDNFRSEMRAVTISDTLWGEPLLVEGDLGIAHAPSSVAIFGRDGTIQKLMNAIKDQQGVKLDKVYLESFTETDIPLTPIDSRNRAIVSTRDSNFVFVMDRRVYGDESISLTARILAGTFTYYLANQEMIVQGRDLRKEAEQVKKEIFALTNKDAVSLTAIHDQFFQSMLIKTLLNAGAEEAAIVYANDQLTLLESGFKPAVPEMIRSVQIFNLFILLAPFVSPTSAYNKLRGHPIYERIKEIVGRKRFAEAEVFFSEHPEMQSMLAKGEMPTIEQMKSEYLAVIRDDAKRRSELRLSDVDSERLKAYVTVYRALTGESVSDADREMASQVIVETGAEKFANEFSKVVNVSPTVEFYQDQELRLAGILDARFKDTDFPVGLIFGEPKDNLNHASFVGRIATQIKTLGIGNVILGGRGVLSQIFKNLKINVRPNQMRSHIIVAELEDGVPVVVFDEDFDVNQLDAMFLPIVSKGAEQIRDPLAKTHNDSFHLQIGKTTGHLIKENKIFARDRTGLHVALNKELREAGYSFIVQLDGNGLNIDPIALRLQMNMLFLEAVKSSA